MRVAIPHLAYTGQAVVRLSKQSLSSTLLPVEAGQRVTLTAYAHATPAPTRRWLVPAAQAIAGSLVIGPGPAAGPGLPEQPQPARRQVFPYLGVGVALGLPHLRHAPRNVLADASLQYRLYDQAGACIGAGQQPIPNATTGWQPLKLTATVPTKGFIQLVLINASPAPLYIDDLQAQLSAPIAPATVVRRLATPSDVSLANGGGNFNNLPVTNLRTDPDSDPGNSNGQYNPHPGEPTGSTQTGGPGPGFPGGNGSYPLSGVGVTGFPPSNPTPYFPPVYSPGQYTPNDPKTGGGGGGSSPTLSPDVVFATPPPPNHQIADIKEHLKCFDQSKAATFSVYATQPKPGTRSTWVGNPANPDVGHTFISITQGGITRVVGFYPAAGITPANPSGPSTLADDSDHDYSVRIDVTLTPTQLSSLLNYVSSFSSTYNLNSYNCTDFGIGASAAAGLSLPTTQGKWLGGLGHGNDPGDLGEDMRTMPLPPGATRDAQSGQADTYNGKC